MSLQGYTVPRTPRGQASLVPPPPWHYVGDFLVDRLPRRSRGRGVAAAGGAGAASRTPAAAPPSTRTGSRAREHGDELLDPSRSHYREFYIVINALLDGEEVTTCPFIWVDQDFAMARGWIQGFPKKLGEVWTTRTFALECRAAPGLRSGSRFGGTCSAARPRDLAGDA